MRKEDVLVKQMVICKDGWKNEQIFHQKHEPTIIQHKTMDLVKMRLCTNHPKIVYGSVMDLAKMRLFTQKMDLPKNGCEHIFHQMIDTENHVMNHMVKMINNSHKTTNPSN